MTFHTKPKTGMILCAGQGTRLRPITNTIPKALVKVDGISMLDRIIEQLRDAGMEKIIVNTCYLAELIHDHLSKNHPDVIISHEDVPSGLETGGGILNAMESITKEPYLVVNGDLLITHPSMNPLNQLLDAWNPEKMEALLLLHDKDTLEDYSGEGDFDLSPEQTVIRSSGTRKFVYCGACIIAPEFFKGYEVHKFSTRDILFKSTDGQLPYYGVINECEWIDIGTPKALEKANQNLAQASA